MSGRDYSLARITTDAFAALVDGDAPVVVLLPVGSVEPHGPHLTLLTDTVISEGAAQLAADRLAARGIEPVIAPAIPYGVTDCAAAFKGAVTVAPAALTAYVRAVIDGWLAGGVAHVCVINNHLEPDHDTAIRAAVEGLAGRASVACPLTKRWARTLSDEFKSGQCHAGQYETSIVMAADPDGVNDPIRETLPEVPVSLSDQLTAGITDFAAMGMTRAYAGAPARATAAEGADLLDKLATMIETEVVEGLGYWGRS
jgi:creatinine amidohydrolase